EQLERLPELSVALIIAWLGGKGPAASPNAVIMIQRPGFPRGWFASHRSSPFGALKQDPPARPSGAAFRATDLGQGNCAEIIPSWRGRFLREGAGLAQIEEAAHDTDRLAPRGSRRGAHTRLAEHLGIAIVDGDLDREPP